MNTKPTIAVVVTLMIVRDGRILLTKRSVQETRAPEDDDKYWHLPGGTLDYGEHPEQTAIREAKEEVGLDVKVHKLIGVTTRTKESHKWHGIIMTYLCSLHDPNQQLTLLQAETTNYAWLNYEDLDDAKLLPGIRDQIDFYFRIDK